jgi:hypothetical protein
MQNLIEICPHCQIEDTLVRKNGILVCSNFELCDGNKDLEKEYLESLLPYCEVPEICFRLKEQAEKNQFLPLYLRVLLREAADSIEMLSNRLIERTRYLTIAKSKI